MHSGTEKLNIINTAPDMHKYWIIIAFTILHSRALAQDYIAYQKILNRIDEDIINNNLPNASLRLDTVYSGYQFIYARHCMKALQICCTANDTQRANVWLGKAFVQGISPWMIRANDACNKVLSYPGAQKILANYTNLHKQYLAGIKQPLARQVDSLLKIDYAHTHKVNDGFVLLRHTLYGLQWLRNNKRQFKIINKMIDTYGYPGEKLIGLPDFVTDSAKGYKDYCWLGPDVELQDRRVQFMLIHYFSSPRPGINDKLMPQVHNGNLPARQYAIFNDFMAENGRRHYPHYYAWMEYNGKDDIVALNDLRAQIGLNAWQQQQRNKERSNELMKGHRKNKEIILE